jgi:hypothetical protein
MMQKLLHSEGECYGKEFLLILNSEFFAALDILHDVQVWSLCGIWMLVVFSKIYILYVGKAL